MLTPEEYQSLAALRRQQDQAAAYARRLLVHYMSQVYRAAGLVWNSELEAETTDIIDSTIAAAKAAAMIEIQLQASQPPSNPYRLPTD